MNNVQPARLWILAILSVVGLVGSAAAEPLPEFYGFYAVDGGVLHEFASTPKEIEGDFTPNVRLILFDKRLAMVPANPSLHRLQFVRFLREPADPADFNAVTCVVKEHRRWVRAEDAERTLELRTKPVPGQSEMVMMVPRDPLKPGAYLVAEDSHVLGYLFVGKDELFANLEAGEDCVDESRRVQGGLSGMLQQFSGGGERILCSRSTMKAGTTDRCQAPASSGAVAGETPQARALEAELATLLQRSPAAPPIPDLRHADPAVGVSFVYPADYELIPKQAPVVVFLMAPSTGQAEDERTKVSLTKATVRRAPTLQAAVDATLKGTGASIQDSTIAGPVNTKMGGADAQVFLVTGKEAGVLRQKAVTVAVVDKHVLGAVLHATPATIEAAWDAYRRVTESYTVQ